MKEIKLKERTLGVNDYSLTVSEIGFGCMGMNYHRGPAPDKKAMINLLHEAVEMGITLFDTAEVYGPYTNEELVGEGLAAFKNTIAVSTKFGFDIQDGKSVGQNSRPGQIRKVAEQSLKRLRRDVIDLFYQHRMDPDVPIEDVAGTVKDLIKEGKVKHFGLCEVSADTIRKAHKVQSVTAVQSEYSLMWREPEEKIFSILEELHIGFVPYSPLGRAYLTGTLNENTRFFADNDNRAGLPRFEPDALKANKPIIDILFHFGRVHKLTPGQISLAWVLAKKEWIIPIPGTTQLKHLEENIVSAVNNISSEEWKQLEDALSQIKLMGDRYPAAQQKQVGK